jgi:hypothetical protein
MHFFKDGGFLSCDSGNLPAIFRISQCQGTQGLPIEGGDSAAADIFCH